MKQGIQVCLWICHYTCDHFGDPLDYFGKVGKMVWQSIKVKVAKGSDLNNRDLTLAPCQ